MALLKLLLSDVEVELSGAVLPHFSLSCKFLALLHSVSNEHAGLYKCVLEYASVCLQWLCRGGYPPLFCFTNMPYYLGGLACHSGMNRISKPSWTL